MRIIQNPKKKINFKHILVSKLEGFVCVQVRGCHLTFYRKSNRLYYRKKTFARHARTPLLNNGENYKWKEI